MTLFVTFTTYDNDDPQAMTEAEFKALAPDSADSADWAEYVWQEAPDRATAILQHPAKMDAYEVDSKAGHVIHNTY